MHGHAAEPDRFLALAEAMSGVGRWRIAVPSNDLMWSDEVYRIHGVNPSEFTPTVETALSFYIAEDQRSVAEFVERGIVYGEPFKFQLRLHRKDGELRHVLCKAECLRDDEGHVSAVLGVFQDITETVLSMDELRKNEGRLRLLADNSSDLVSQCDLGGCFVYVSPVVEAMTGYAISEVIGRPAIEFVHPDDRERVAAEIQASLRSPSGLRIEHRHIRKDGREIWVQSRPKLLRDAVTGRALGVTDAMRDITDQKLTEQTLMQTKRQFSMLAENSADMISRFDLTGKMSYVSPSSVAVLGYTPDELLGRRTWEFVHRDDKAALADQYQTLLASKEGDASVHTQFRAQRKTGEWVWIEGSPKLIRSDDGSPLEVIDVARDITARKELEAELVSARVEAEAGSLAKADFLANMSHELRTPLNSVIGFSRLIAAAPELESETRRRAVLARDASQALLTIVNDILDFSRFESEGVTLSPEPVELNDLVESVADLFRDETEAKDLALKVEVPFGLTQVAVDPLRLRQVLMNLIGNAVKFTARGAVAISLSRDAKGRWKFAVRDTGIGIPHDRQSTIFERFSQADTSVVRRFGGSGLGLTISKSIIEAMSGEIGVFSAEGAGSTFWFTLDLPDASLARLSQVVEHREEGPQANILLVDDNPANCELFKALLDNPDLDITCVTSGPEGIDLVQRGPYDVVFMDVQMPGMDGLEATRRIRALGFASLPIIALTANVMEANVSACLSAGMNGHLGKPFSASEIVAAISKWSGAEEATKQADQQISLAGLTETLGSAKVARFLDALADQLSHLINYIDSPSADEIETARIAHSVRGYAGSLGFSSLAKVLAEFEAACHSPGQPKGIDTATRAVIAKTLSELSERRKVA